MSPEGHDTATWAGWAAFALTAATAFWKSYFGAKAGLRDDHKGALVHGTYEELVESLRDEVRRLREELQHEYRLRMESEERVRQLMERVVELESKCTVIANAAIKKAKDDSRVG